MISTIQQGVASADRVFEILDEKNEVPLPDKPVVLKPMDGRICFRDVWFAYKDKSWVLKGLDFEIEKGQKVAVVGSTGAGKSTLADLVMRFYDPQKGCILIDGTDLRQLDLKTYRRQIGVVPQDPVLMKGTLAYNIGYGFEGVTDADMVKAAEIAASSILSEAFQTALIQRWERGGHIERRPETAHRHSQGCREGSKDTHNG